MIFAKAKEAPENLPTPQGVAGWIEKYLTTTMRSIPAGNWLIATFYKPTDNGTRFTDLLTMVLDSLTNCVVLYSKL